MALFELLPKMRFEIRPGRMVEQRPARPVREIAVHAGFAFEMQHQQGHGHAMFKQPSCRARHGNRVNFTRYFIIEHVEQPVVSHACDPTDRHISIGLEHLKLKTGPDTLNQQRIQYAFRPRSV